MRWLALFLCCIVAPVAAHAAEANPGNYPARPIRIIVPQSPGGTTDFTARFIGTRLSDRVGQTVVVDNRPGAGSVLGTDLVAKAVPDGHTLLVVASSFTINPSLYAKLPFDPVRDFAPVTLLTAYPNVLVVNPAVAANTVQDLIALARAKPGALNYASGGTGTGTQLSAELFRVTTGIKAVHVPYKGGGPANNAVVAGEVQFMFASIASVLTLVKSGKLRALAVTTARRSPAIPAVASMQESGLPDYDENNWNGLFAPARVPRPVIQKLNGELVALLGQAATRERLAIEGAEPVGNSPEAFAEIVKREIARWGGVIKAAGVRAE